MGAVDLVVQVESPPRVASGLQRVGRAGHQVGAVSRGRDLPEVPRRPRRSARWSPSGCAAGAIESMRYPRNPLDVLAQQIVADGRDGRLARSTSCSRWSAAPRRSPTLPAVGAATRVLDMLAGRYPCDEFAELRPRLVWDRVTGALTGRPGAQRLAVTSGGTIPDRGLFGVFLVGGDEPGRAGRRARRGDGLRVARRRRLRCSARRQLADRGHHPRPGARHARARRSPGGCRSGRATRSAGRSSWAGRSARSCASSATPTPTSARDAAARRRARRLGRRQPARLPRRAARGHRAPARRPHDRGRAVPRRARRLAARACTRPFGAQVQRAVGAGDRGPAARAATASTCRSMHSDDGIVLRLPDTDDDAAAGARTSPSSTPTRSRRSSPTEVGGSALFASRFRECAARALLLPRRDPRPAHAAVAAAAARRAAARGGARVRRVPDRARDGARVPAGRLRRARPASS